MGLACSLEDMSLLMRALLAPRGDGVAGVLPQTLRAAMQSRARNNERTANGLGWLMNVTRDGSHELLWAQGFVNDTASLLILEPQSGRGLFFVACGGVTVAEAALLDFVGIAQELLAVPAAARPRTLDPAFRPYLGTYRSLRQSRRTAEAFLDFIYPVSTVKVSPIDAAHVSIDGVVMRHIGDRVFQNEGLALELDPKSFREIAGRRFLLSSYYAYEQVPRLRDAMIMRRTVEVASVLVLLLTMVVAFHWKRQLGWGALLRTGAMLVLLVSFWRVAMSGVERAAAIWELGGMNRTRLALITLEVDALFAIALLSLWSAGFALRTPGAPHRTVCWTEFACATVVLAITGILSQYHVLGWQLP
jgi:hypothetical protein